TSVPTKTITYEAVNEEIYESLERAAATATSLDAEQDRGNISKTQSKATPSEPSSPGTSSGGGPRRQDTMGDTIAQTRFKNVSNFSNDLPLLRVNTLGKTTKIAQAKEISNLKKRVKRLEKKQRSRTHGLKRVYKVGLSERVESFVDEESLGEEDASKLRRISDIDANKDIYLEVAGKDVSDVEEINAVSITTSVTATTTTTATTPTISMDEITLAKALIEIKTSRPKAKGIVMQEPSETPTPTPIVSS
nr:hypothetical protein [Tanacetum cinerariifolium]